MPSHPDSLPEPIEALLVELMALSKGERSARLEAACAEHPEHARALRERLGQLEELERNLVHDVDAPDRPEWIGDYKVLSVLGEGGIGKVFLAEQRSGLVRRVAVKVVKLGMDTERVLARFALERQALAMMQHDNIAKVFDAGVTAEGRPYFVMEYVHGVPITSYCAAQRLGLDERLELFLQVCAGVQHAHNKGVIHRDLKPSNVLVTAVGERAVVKIIDFGLARATDHRLVEETLFTEEGRIVGTPAYMSPEQAGLSRLDIDTRTDVYSLGVLLYELLTGQLPFDSSVGLFEMQRRVREEEPPTPSTRVSTADAEAHEHAAQRRTDLHGLARRLRGDLDWITMKALAKDRTQRYQTPAALADDVRRHLDDEPVSAGPPTLGYRLAKLARRHRGRVVAGGLIAASLLVGGGVSVWFGLAAREALAAQRRLLVGAELDELEYRATRAVPAWPENEAELADLVARGEAWVARLPALERDLAALARAADHDAPAERRAKWRGPHVLAAYREELARERRFLAVPHDAIGLDAEYRPEARRQLEALDAEIARVERRIARANRVRFDRAADQLAFDRLDAGICRVERLRDELLPDLRRRLAWARRVRAASVDRHGARWRRTLAGLAADERYRGMAPFPPQVGLVPLGPDPKSGLFEFAHLASGEAPERGPDGRLRLGPRHGIVFVLLPPGSVRFGVDSRTPPDEREDREKHPEIQIRSVLIAKHELSRRQWSRLAAGVRGLRLRDGALDLRNVFGDQLEKPANAVSWRMAAELLARHGLELPTEAEWEYACKAGTEGVFSFGDDPASLEGRENLLDRTYVAFWSKRGRRVTGDVAAFADGFMGLAPVHSMRPNAFGLHHLHGNVREWCADVLGGSGDLRAIRGGSFLSGPDRARTVRRDRTVPTDAARDTGVRPVRRLRR